MFAICFMADALSKLKVEGTQETFIEEMMTRKELYEIIGYEDYEGIEEKIRKKIELNSNLYSEWPYLVQSNILQKLYN